MPILHGKIIKCMEVLGYRFDLGHKSKPDLTMRDGVCVGIADSVMVEALLNPRKFYLLGMMRETLDTIASFPPNELKGFLENPLEFTPTAETKEQFKWLNESDVIGNGRKNVVAGRIKKLCNSIYKYQYEQETVYQNEPHIISTEEGNVVKAGGFSGIYNYQEVTKYILGLDELIKDINYPITLSLSCMEHRIQITSDGHGWWLIDANQDPIIRNFSIGRDFAHELMGSLFATEHSVKNVAFSTRLYSAEENSLDLTNRLNNFKNSAIFKEIHTVNKDKAKQATSSNITWLHLAVENRDDQLIADLLKAGADPNAKIVRSGSQLNARTPWLYIYIKPELRRLLPSENSHINKEYCKNKIYQKWMESSNHGNALFRNINLNHLRVLIQMDLNIDNFPDLNINDSKQMENIREIHNSRIIEALDKYIVQNKWFNRSKTVERLINDALSNSALTDIEKIQSVFAIAAEGHNNISKLNLMPNREKRNFYKMLVDVKDKYQLNHIESNVDSDSQRIDPDSGLKC